MVDPNSREFIIGKKIGHIIMTYVGIRLIIKGFYMVCHNGKLVFLPFPQAPKV